jgi:hypothetical protein
MIINNFFCNDVVLKQIVHMMNNKPKVIYCDIFSQLDNINNIIIDDKGHKRNAINN